jgi:hypothetical protein
MIGFESFIGRDTMEGKCLLCPFFPPPFLSILSGSRAEPFSKSNKGDANVKNAQH